MLTFLSTYQSMSVKEGITIDLANDENLSMFAVSVPSDTVTQVIELLEDVCNVRPFVSCFIAPYALGS